MLINSTKYLIILFVLLFQNPQLYSQEQWKLSKEGDGVKIFTKKFKNFDFKSFRANMIIDGSVHDFIGALSDIEGFMYWGDKIKSTNLLEKSGDTLQIYYSVVKVPFPYKNRDGIYLNKFKWAHQTKTLFVDIDILYDYLEIEEKFERVKGDGHWEIIELPSNKIDITFQMQLDPGGNIPSWIANIFIDDSPFRSMIRLKEIIESGKYENRHYNFVD